MKRLAVFSHFDVDDIIDDYVLYYLHALDAVCDLIVFVSTAALNTQELQKLKGLSIKPVVRENIGYDFYSYKTGLFSVDYAAYDEILICNDSVFGPFEPLQKVFDKMETKKCDFWGILSSREGIKHLQSFFIVFRKGIIKSKAFFDFFDGIKILENKRQIIDSYEIGLSSFFKKYSYNFLSYCKSVHPVKRMRIYRQILSTHEYILNSNYPVPIAQIRRIIRILRNKWKYFRRLVIKNTLNPSIFYWQELLEAGNPFIKIELLRNNPLDYDCMDEAIACIQKKYDYPVALIESCIHRTAAKYRATRSPEP